VQFSIDQARGVLGRTPAVLQGMVAGQVAKTCPHLDQIKRLIGHTTRRGPLRSRGPPPGGLTGRVMSAIRGQSADANRGRERLPAIPAPFATLLGVQRSATSREIDESLAAALARRTKRSPGSGSAGPVGRSATKVPDICTGS